MQCRSSPLREAIALRDGQSSPDIARLQREPERVLEAVVKRGEIAPPSSVVRRPMVTDGVITPSVTYCSDLVLIDSEIRKREGVELCRQCMI